MRTAYIAYTDTDLKKASAIADTSDTIIAIGLSDAGVAYDCRTRFLPIEGALGERQLAVDTIEAFSEFAYPWLAFVNNMYRSALGPLQSTVASAVTEVKQSGCTQVVEMRGWKVQLFPSALTGWGESARRFWVSPDMLISLPLRRGLCGLLGPKAVRTLRWGHFGATRLATRAALIAVGVSLRKLRRWRPRRTRLPAEEPLAVIVVRSAHQLRMTRAFLTARGLTESSVLLAIDEMIASKDLLREVSEGNSPFVDMSNGAGGLVDTVKSMVKCCSILWAPKPRRSVRFTAAETVTIEVDLTWILLDTIAKPSVVAHGYQVRRLMNTMIDQYSSCPIIVGFEQFSPQAYLLGTEGERSGSKTVLLKSTALSRRTFPTVGTASRFVVESEEEAETLRESAVVGHERILVADTFARPRRLRDVGGPPRVLFASQPHDRANSLRIARDLEQVCRDRYSLTVRPHPRELDVDDFAAVAEIDEFSDLYDSIGSTALVVSRTSSVLDDAVKMGVPAIAVLTSGEDQRFFDGVDFGDGVLAVKSLGVELHKAVESALSASRSQIESNEVATRSRLNWQQFAKLVIDGTLNEENVR